MVSFVEALNIAKEYYSQKKDYEITKVYENDNSWIVFAGKKNMPRFGSAGISIDKLTAKISVFMLPTRENFEILKNSKLIVME